MSQLILSIVARWLWRPGISVEKRLTALRGADRHLERSMARRVYLRLRAGRRID